jgi:hypothetical protein
MNSSGQRFQIAAAAAAAWLCVLAAPAAAEVVRAVEYYHQEFEHYFVTSNPLEIAALDGRVFKGWWRTGQRYRVDTSPADGLVPVCRFYTSAYAGKASHFFTASESECAHVKTMPDWTYEGVAFYARAPDADGKCAAGTAVIQRLFNNGQGGAPNHAYTVDAKKLNALVGAGWISEGVAYCTPLAAGDPMAQTLVLNGSTWDLPVPAVFSTFFPDTVVGRVQIQFLPITDGSVEGAALWFEYYGLAVPPTPIMHDGEGLGNNGFGGGGPAAWDPVAGEYVVELDGYVDTDPLNRVKIPREWWGMIWTFDAAVGPTTPVCTMGIGDNGTNHQTGVAHPFQQWLFSGCEPGVASRLK